MTDYVTTGSEIHERGRFCFGQHSNDGKLCKPVLVLDPDDAEQMQAFSSLYEAARYHHGSGAKEAAAAVRSMLEPEPEYPPEPTDLAVRVTTGVRGFWWARLSNGYWMCHRGELRKWSDLCREFGPVEIITPDGDS